MDALAQHTTTQSLLCQDLGLLGKTPHQLLPHKVPYQVVEHTWSHLLGSMDATMCKVHWQPWKPLRRAPRVCSCTSKQSFRSWWTHPTSPYTNGGAVICHTNGWDGEIEHGM